MLPNPTEAAAYRRNVILATPFALLVPVGIAILMVALGHELRPLAIGAGVGGWILAYLLRGPVAIYLRSRGDEQLQSPWLVAASGPTEELVRLGAVLALGRDLDTALSIGLGWAGIEVLFTIMTGLALGTLLTRDDEEARRVREVLPPPPGGFSPSSAWWGVWERVWASALHIGFTLIIAAQPLLVLVTIPLHSAVNLLSLRFLSRWGMARMELLGALAAAVVVAVAVVLWQGPGGRSA